MRCKFRCPVIINIALNYNLRLRIPLNKFERAGSYGVTAIVIAEFRLCGR